MMLKPLLLLCLTAGHVIGETPQVIARNVTLSPPTVTSLNGTTQHVDTDSASIIVSAEPVADSLDVTETETKSGKLPYNTELIKPNPIYSKPATVVPPDTKIVSPDKHELEAPGKWIVNGTDKVCVIVQMSVTFNVSYTHDNQTESFKVFDLPAANSTVNVTGDCGELDQYLTLQWSSKNVTNATMTMHFIKHEPKNRYAFHHLDVVLPPVNIPDSGLNESLVLVHEAHNLDIELSNSYRCLKQQTLNLKQNNTNETAGYLTLMGLQFQAFKTDYSTVFGLAKDCAIDTPDVVPIAVGCALAGLVVIVLIAYLIGRRLHQSQGYSSM